MGDTHYWTIKNGEKWTSVWDDIVGDIHRIVDYYVQAHPESMGFRKGQTQPCVDVRFKDHYVVINDAVEEAENVILQRNKRGFDCCKSVYHSFDIVLQAVLLRMHHYMGDEGLDISSDVEWDEWERGVGLVKKVFGVDEVQKPKNIED